MGSIIWLFLSMSGNIIAGTYNNVLNLQKEFNFKRLVEGILKAMIIAYSFFTIYAVYTYLITVFDLGMIEFEPQIIMDLGIMLYFVKTSQHLIKILDINYVGKGGK